MNNNLSAKERAYIGLVKELPCSVCDAPAPSEAHHIEQHKQYLCIPLCSSCHRDNFNGLHGQKRIWKVLKKDEMSCLNETLRKIIDGMV